MHLWSYDSTKWEETDSTKENDKQMKRGDVDFKYSDNVYVLNDIIGPTLR